jgi:hypothetical protein
MSDQQPSFPPRGPGDDFNTPPGTFGDPFAPVGRKGKPARSRKPKKAKSTKAPKEVVATQRVMNTQRLLAAFFALIVLLAVVVMVSAKKPVTYVVEVNQAVTSLSPISRTELIAVSLPKNTDVAQGAFSSSNAQAAIDKAIRSIGKKDPLVALPAYTVITKSFFAQLPQVAANLGLPTTNEVVAVNADVVVASGGILTTGSHVEVVWAPTEGKPAVLSANATILSVRASLSAYENAAGSQTGSNINKNSNQLLPTSPIPGIYLLSVDPADALSIAGAVVSTGGSDGSISLIYLPQPASSATGSGSSTTGG